MKNLSVDNDSPIIVFWMTGVMLNVFLILSGMFRVSVDVIALIIVTIKSNFKKIK